MAKKLSKCREVVGLLYTILIKKDLKLAKLHQNFTKFLEKTPEDPRPPFFSGGRLPSRTTRVFIRGLITLPFQIQYVRH